MLAQWLVVNATCCRGPLRIYMELLLKDDGGKYIVVGSDRRPASTSICKTCYSACNSAHGTRASRQQQHTARMVNRPHDWLPAPRVRQPAVDGAAWGSDGPPPSQARHVGLLTRRAVPLFRPAPPAPPSSRSDVTAYPGPHARGPTWRH